MMILTFLLITFPAEIMGLIWQLRLNGRYSRDDVSSAYERRISRDAMSLHSNNGSNFSSPPPPFFYSLSSPLILLFIIISAPPPHPETTRHHTLPLTCSFPPLLSPLPTSVCHSAQLLSCCPQQLVKLHLGCHGDGKAHQHHHHRDLLSVLYIWVLMSLPTEY